MDKTLVVAPGIGPEAGSYWACFVNGIVGGDELILSDPDTERALQGLLEEEEEE